MIAGLISMFVVAQSGTVAAESVIAPGAKLQKLAGDFAFTEGPAVAPNGDIYFTDQPNDRILVWSTAGKLSTFLQPSGRSNGLCFDNQGRLWACADGNNELWRIDIPTKSYEVILRQFEGKRFNGPNDIWVRKDGGAFFTDPYYKRPYWKHSGMPQESQQVYFLPANGKGLRRITTDLTQPNGIIGTPDGKTLYVADIGAGKTYAYDIQSNGDLTGKRLFCGQGSDGLTIDREGNVYLTSRGVAVYNRKGTKIDQIDIPENWTANVCFGGADRKTLFVTASTGLYSIRTKFPGAASQ